MVKVFNFESNYNEFSANTYVVGELNGPCVIIDLGSTGRRVLDYVKTNHTEVKAILLTHGHYDHIRGVDKFLDQNPNVPVYIDRYDIELTTNPKLNCSHLDRESVEIHHKVSTFKDLDILDFGEGLEFEVIETPFHTDGSVCFINRASSACFSGDTLFKGSIGRSDLTTSNRNYIESSLEKVKSFDKNLVVYPGHGEITTINDELINNYFLK